MTAQPGSMFVLAFGMGLFFSLVCGAQDSPPDEEAIPLNLSDSPDIIEPGKTAEPPQELPIPKDLAEPTLLREAPRPTAGQELGDAELGEPMLLTLPSAKRAQNSLEDLVELDISVLTSGKQETKLREVPESISVITADEIKNSGAVTLPDVLRLLPGLNVTQISHGHYDVNIRDKPYYIITQVLVMVDSRPINVQFHDLIPWPASLVVMDNIERVEVIKGPGSTLYGSNALNGIINIITKKPAADRLALRLESGPQLGQELTTKWGNVYASGVWSDTWDRLGASLAAAFHRAEPWEDGKYLGSEKSFSALVDVNASAAAFWKPRPRATLTARGSISRYTGDFFVVLRGPTDYDNFRVDLEYEQTGLLADADQLTLKAHHRNTGAEATVPLDAALPLLEVTDRESSTAASLLYRFTLADGFTTLVGLEDELQNVANPLISPRAKQVNILAAFIQERVRPNDSLILTGGLRFERQFVAADTRSLFVGQASAVYFPSLRHTLRLSVGQGFKNPTLLGRFTTVTLLDGDLPFMGENLALQPEKLTSLEGGYQLNATRKLKLSMNAYLSWLENEIETHQNPAYVPLVLSENTARTTHLYGYEITVSYAPVDFALLRIGYSLNMNDRPFYRSVPRSPFHKLNLSLWLRPSSRLDINLSLYATSFYHQDSLFTEESNIINPIDILNLRVAYALLPGLRVVLTGSNLVDIRWGDTFRDGAADVEHGVPGAERIGTRIWLGLELDR